ncbi:hypothetical protein GALL_448180 [mine drainage metagenome]|uniref:Lipoprotein n=1 Tax=mine drainage metagenome TaxID=410659 RepID=A0A1J5PPX9_9ZZZZ
MRRALVLTAVLGVVLTGCTTGPVGSSSVPVHSADWFEAGSKLCASTPGPALAVGMKRSVARTRRVPTYPIALSADGSRMFVSTYGRDFSGVAELVVASGRLHPIHAFAHPDRYGAGGAFDGRYLVWFEYHSLYGLDDFTAYSYDTRSGTIRVIGQPHTDAQGNLYSSPWQDPVASAGYAAFALGVGAGGLTEVVGVELATGVRKVLRRGHAQAPIMVGTTVIWPESAAPGVETTLRAVDVRTGRTVELSPVLRAVHGTLMRVGNGTEFAYTNPSHRELFYSPAPGIPAKSVLRLDGYEQFQGLGMAAHTLVWTTTEATYVADTRTGRYARLVTYGGWVASTGAVSIGDPPSIKMNHPISAEHVLRVADIEIQPCPVPAR